MGAFFCNTRRGTGICQVCTGPATGSLCPKCRAHRASFGDQLADAVVPLAYVKGRMRPTHQSEHHVYGYKGEPAAPKCRRDLLLMVFAASVLHAECVGRATGSQWDAVTFVPSVQRPSRSHPVAQLAGQVISRGPVARPLLRLGPGAAQIERAPREDGFVVSPEDNGRITGRHVLVVEDTWVSGAKAQSAAVALKDAGAGTVTVLAVARWLRHDWDDHRALIDSLHQPYDALICPVSGGHCPA